MQPAPPARTSPAAAPAAPPPYAAPYAAAPAAATAPGRPFQVPMLLSILLTVGFALFALSRILILAEFTQALGDEEGDVGGTVVTAFWLSEVAVLLLSGGLVLGGAWGRLPGWAQVTLAATGVFVAVTAGGPFPGTSALWYGLF